MTVPHKALHLRAALGDHAHVAPLKDGRVTSPLLEWEFIEFKPLPAAFRRLLREGDLDLSEMAVASHLLGLDAGRPITALPIPLWGRLPHGNLLCLRDSPIRTPRDLEGRRVGVRSYAQTSGVWVRGILQTAYGVDPDRITWVTLEDAHVAEFADPPNAIRAAPGARLRDLLQAGEVQAIMGEREIDPAGVRTVIPDAEAAGRAWAASQRIDPIHHIVTLRRELLAGRPWLAAELMHLFEQARRVAQGDGPAATPDYGLAPNRRSLDAILDYSYAQQLTRRRYAADDIFVAA
ncbi:MAG TPA: ABC transporter substrate-binding protein [Bordetella sp.]